MVLRKLWKDGISSMSLDQDGTGSLPLDEYVDWRGFDGSSCGELRSLVTLWC